MSAFDTSGLAGNGGAALINTAQPNDHANLQSLNIEAGVFLNGTGSIKKADGTSLGSWGTGTDVAFTKRVSAAIKLRFPEDANTAEDIGHRTLRLGHDGNPNKFYDEDMTTRVNARNDYAAFMQSNLQPTWKQAGLDLYITADTSWRIPITDIPNDQFTNNAFKVFEVVNGKNRATKEVRGLKTKQIAGNVNIYFVKDFTKGLYPAINAMVLDGLAPGTNHHVIVVDDNANFFVLAHEIGHAFSLDEVENQGPAILRGQYVNNLQLLFGDLEAQHSLLMWSGAYSTPTIQRTGDYMLRNQAMIARKAPARDGVLGPNND